MIITDKDIIEGIKWVSSHWFIEERESFLSEYIFNVIYMGSYMPLVKNSEEKYLSDFVVGFEDGKCMFKEFLNGFLEKEIERSIRFIVDNYSDSPPLITKLKSKFKEEDMGEFLISFLKKEYAYEYEAILVEPIRRDYMTEMRLIKYNVVKTYYLKNMNDLNNFIRGII